jgi:signal transduction histidine kinase
MNKNRILIVDDNPRNTAIVKRILADRYLLAEAPDGETALDVVELFQPDIVLLDIMLPGIDGYEVCRRIKANTVLPNTKIIMVTAKAMAAEKLRGYEAGTDDYVTKPFDGDELLAKVEIYLRLKTAEEHEALKTNLLTLVGHETRTPLTYVLGAAEGLKDNEIPADKQQELVGIICDGASRISELISKALRYGEVKSGISIDLATSFDLGEAVDIALSNLTAMADRKSIRIQRSGNRAPGIMGDMLQMIEALQAVIDSAMRFSPAGDTVTIHTADHGSQVTLSVSDNGEGLSPSILATLLDGFHVADIDHHSRGDGMSLAIARAIIEAHRGDLDVSSEEGSGTTFTIELPIAREVSVLDPRP